MSAGRLTDAADLIMSSDHTSNSLERPAAKDGRPDEGDQYRKNIRGQGKAYDRQWSYDRVIGVDVWHLIITIQKCLYIFPDPS